MGTALIPVERVYDTKIIGVAPEDIGKKIYDILPAMSRAILESAQLVANRIQNPNTIIGDVKNIIHEQVGHVAKAHAVIAKVFSEYCPNSGVHGEYRALGHRLPNKDLLDKVQTEVGFKLHPDKFSNNPELQKQASHVLSNVNGSIEFLRSPPQDKRHAVQTYNTIVDGIKKSPDGAAKLEAAFAEIKGQKPSSSVVQKLAKNLKGKKILIALGAGLAALGVYAGYKALKGKKSEEQEIEYKGVSSAAQGGEIGDKSVKSFVAAENERRANNAQKAVDGSFVAV